MKLELVLLNGAPGVGKDTAVRDMNKSICFSSARAVKEGAHRAFNLDVPYDHFENTKDQSGLGFCGVTPREVYIAYAEQFMKPLCGDCIFGTLVASSIISKLENTRDFNRAYITDIGFLPEFNRIIEMLSEVCEVSPVIVGITRDGHTFEKDSRKSVEHSEVPKINIENNDSVEDLIDTFTHLVNLHFNKIK